MFFQNTTENVHEVAYQLGVRLSDKEARNICNSIADHLTELDGKPIDPDLLPTMIKRVVKTRKSPNS